MQDTRTKINVDFMLKALESEEFAKYFSYTEGKLSAIGAKLFEADAYPGTPCRVSLEDARIGDNVLAINFVHHDVKSPYKGSGPIFVRQGVNTAQPAINEIPKMLFQRPLSIRAYDEDNMMIKCDVSTGDKLSELLRAMFSDGHVEYIHIHNAKPGCYNCSAHRC